jgi:hypothetical protein
MSINDHDKTHRIEQDLKESRRILFPLLGLPGSLPSFYGNWSKRLADKKVSG